MSYADQLTGRGYKHVFQVTPKGSVIGKAQFDYAIELAGGSSKVNKIAILFEDTMDREVLGRPTGEYLWEVKKVVPILKVDKGLEAEADGVQLMKPMPGLDELLARGRLLHVPGA